MTDDPVGGLPPMIAPAELAVFLDVSVGLLAKWRSDGHGPPYVKVTGGRNGLVRYPRERLRTYLRDNTRNATGVQS